MHAKRWGAAAGLVCALGAAPGGASASDDPAGGAPAKFAEPVRLKAGDKWLGEGRMYPSPAMQDLDGDGIREVVIADIRGRPTWAKVTKSADGAVAVSEERPLLGRDRKPLDFENW